MPYFKWMGIDIVGKDKQGKLIAFSSEDLAHKLLQQGVALLHFKIMRTSKYAWPVNAKIKSDVFKQIEKLLEAGLLLPKALEIVAQQSAHPLIYNALYVIQQNVQKGIPFNMALAEHPLLYDPIVMIMLSAGYESGNFAKALEKVALYFHKNYVFTNTIHQIIAMPLLTLLFFLGISFFIFVFIIPRFADMFNSFQQDLPLLTRCMISCSEFLVSSSIVYTLLAFGVFIFCVYRYFHTASGKKKWNSILCHLPFVNNIVWSYYMSQVLQAGSLLVRTGVPFVDSLKIIIDSIENSAVQFQLKNVYNEIISGRLLSDVMSSTSLFLPEVVALICVGEQTGNIAYSLETAAVIYNDLVEVQLKRFVFILQPVLIIFLGLLVTMLIFAVYSPILQLSYVM